MAKPSQAAHLHPMDGETDSAAERHAELPAHIEATIASIARLHADHERAVSPWQRLIARGVKLAGRPAFTWALICVFTLWITANLLLRGLGAKPPDPPPFQWLELATSVAALFMTVLILSTQRHEEELSDRRAQLTLQLTILAEQKSAKIIELLEEMRRDSPHLADRTDDAAAAMAEPSNPRSVLQAIRESHAGAVEGEG